MGTSTYKSWGFKKPPLGWRVNAQAANQLGLIAAFLLNENGGGISNNLIAPATFGTNTAVDWNPGLFGSCGLFNGNTSEILIPSSIWNQVSGSNGAFSVWFNTTGSLTSFQALCSSLNRNIAVFIESATELLINVGGNPATFQPTLSVTLATNRWYHCVVTWAAASGKVYVYINGQQVGSSTWNSGTFTLTDSWAIGFDPSGDGVTFTGREDVPLLSNMAWTPDQVLQLYKQPFWWMQAPRQRLWTSAGGLFVGEDEYDGSMVCPIAWKRRDESKNLIIPKGTS